MVNVFIWIKSYFANSLTKGCLNYFKNYYRYKLCIYYLQMHKTWTDVFLNIPKELRGDKCYQLSWKVINSYIII